MIVRVRILGEYGIYVPAVDGFFEGFDETVKMMKGGWSLAMDAWNSVVGNAELKAEAMQRNRDRWQNIVEAFQSFVEMMRDPKVKELIEKFFPPEFLILLREPIGSPKFCEALGKLGFNALMDALIGLASGGALAGIKKVMGLGGEALKDAIEAAGKHVRKCTNCFVAGTLVVTACGWVPIEEVQAGDWVSARDEVTGEVRLCEVEETYRNESPVILELTAGGETLATTPGHPFWVLDHGWKDAGELEVGDHLVNLRGESVVVEDIRRRPVPEAVYNFSVAGLHTYFVGQGGIWVHNNSGTGCGVGGGAAVSATGLETRGFQPPTGTRLLPKGLPEGWRVRPTKGEGGTWYFDPKNKGNAVRVMPGDQTSPFPNSQAPYVRWQSNGRPLDVNGNPLPTKFSPDAHIPLQDFRFSPDPFK